MLMYFSPFFNIDKIFKKGYDRNIIINKKI